MPSTCEICGGLSSDKVCQDCWANVRGTNEVESPKIVPTDEQRLAYEEIIAWALDDTQPHELSLSGAAGTGKSTILRFVSDGLEEAGVYVTWTAMTGKAALRLAECVEWNANTLHSTLYAPPRRAMDGPVFASVAPTPESKVIVIDEASMVTPTIRDDLQVWVADGRKILYVGDGYQLPPILSKPEEKKEGKDFSIFCTVRGPSLTTVMRTDDKGILGAANTIRDKGTLPATQGRYTFTDLTMDAVADSFVEDPDGHVVVTWRNAVRMALNDLIRAKQGRTSPLPVKGEQVLFCLNNAEAGVMNGQVGVVESIHLGRKLGKVQTHDLRLKDGRNLMVYAMGKNTMDGGTPYFPDKKDWYEYVGALRKHNVLDPVPITWAACMTAHKAQGSGYRRVSVYLPQKDRKNQYFNKMTVLPDGATAEFYRRWLYTAISRAEECVSLIVDGFKPDAPPVDEDDFLKPPAKPPTPKTGPIRTIEMRKRTSNKKPFVSKYDLVFDHPRLQKVLSKYGGTHKVHNSGFKFTFPSGAIFCWWPNSGKSVRQGRGWTTELEEALDKAVYGG